MRIQQHLTQISGQAEDECQIIDTLPLPVCTYTRARRDETTISHENLKKELRKDAYRD